MPLHAFMHMSYTFLHSGRRNAGPHEVQMRTKGRSKRKETRLKTRHEEDHLPEEETMQMARATEENANERN